MSCFLDYLWGCTSKRFAVSWYRGSLQRGTILWVHGGGGGWHQPLATMSVRTSVRTSVWPSNVVTHFKRDNTIAWLVLCTSLSRCCWLIFTVCVLGRSHQQPVVMFTFNPGGWITCKQTRSVLVCLLLSWVFFTGKKNRIFFFSFLSQGQIFWRDFSLKVSIVAALLWSCVTVQSFRTSCPRCCLHWR